MIISLDLYESYHKSTDESVDDSSAQDEKYNALRLSYDILSSRRAFSRDARRGSNVLSIMLAKVQRPDNASTRINPSQDTSNLLHASVSGGNMVGIAGISPASSLWNTMNSNELSQDFPLDNPASTGFTFPDALDNIFGESEHIDWVFI
jgi:hypothetical protein